MLRVIFASAVLLCSASPSPSFAASWTDQARIDRWFDDLERTAGSSAGLPPLVHLTDHQEEADVALRLDALAQRLLKRSSTDPVVAARLREWLGTRADRRGDAEASRRYFAEAGYLAHWATLGPYPNYGGASMGRVMGPEADGCAEGCEHEGREMAWIERPGFGEHGFLNLGACMEERSDTIAFLRTFVHVEQDTEAALYVGSDDGIVVELGGRVVLREPERRTPRPDQQAVGVVLPEGWSELRIKSGHERGIWGVYLRVTRPDGRPLDGVRVQAAPPDQRSTAPEAPVQVHDPVADALAAAEFKDADADALMLAATLAVSTGVLDRRDEAAVQLLRQALELQPEDPELLIALAEESDEPEERLQCIRRALELAPDMSAAHLAHYRYLRRQGNRRDDLAALERAAEHPSALEARRALATELGDLGSPEAALALLERTEEHHPSATTLQIQRAQQWLDLGNEPRALACYERALELADMASTRSRRMGLLRETGDVEGTLADARVLAERFPHAIRYHKGLARELERAGDLEGAEAHLRAVLPRFPDAASMHRELGDLLRRLGRDEEAFEAWNLSLALRPRDPALEQYMRFIEGDDDPLRERWRVDPWTLPDQPTDPALVEGAPARVLLLNRAIQVFANGSDQEYVQQVIQIDSEMGGRAFETISMSYDRERERLRVLAADVLHADGTVSAASRVWDESGVSKAAGAYYQVYVKQVAFDELGPGDRVHLEYRRESREKRNRFNDFFGTMAPLQNWVPTLDARMHIVVPEEMVLFWGGRGVEEAAAVVEDGQRLHTFVTGELPALASERHGAGYYEEGAYLSATNFGSWDLVAEWWLDLSREQFRLGEDGERIAAELAADKETTQEIVAAVFEYVVRNTHYVGLEFGIHGWKPYEAREVLERGYGDCKDKATLLVALLGAAGVEAEVVLLQTVTGGKAEPQPANLHLFNHAIAYVPELDLYLDATAEYAPLESLRWDDQGANALHIALDGGSALREIPLSAPEANFTISYTTVELDSNGYATFHEHWVERGLQVSEIRHAFHDDSTRREDLEHNYQGRIPGVRLTDVEVTGFDDLSNELVIEVDGQIPALARFDGDRIRVPVTLFPDELGMNMAPEGDTSRRTDLVLRLPSSADLSTTLVPPPGMVVEQVPDPVHLDTAHASYHQVATVEDGNAVVRIQVVYKHRRIPLSDYPAFRAFCLAVDRAQDQTVILAPEGGTP
jgi:cellulose synthase operon protein C